MAGAFIPIYGDSGLYQISSDVSETSPGSGLYTTADLVETSPGSGLYIFTSGAISPDITFTIAPPSTHVVYDGADMIPGTQTIIVSRVAGGVTTTVRSALNAFAAGGFVFDDWEAPIGVPITYQAEMFDSDGNSLGLNNAVSVTIPAEGIGIGWISDPLDASSAVRIRMDRNAGQSPSRPMIGNLYQVGLKTISLVGKPSLATGLVMDFYTETESDRDAILALLDDTGGLILLRTPPPMMVPRMLYCWAQNTSPAEYALPAGVQKVKWANTVNEISEPAGNPVVVSVPYQAYIDAFPTYQDAAAAYASYFDAMKNPPGGA